MVRKFVGLICLSILTLTASLLPASSVRAEEVMEAAPGLRALVKREEMLARTAVKLMGPSYRLVLVTVDAQTRSPVFEFLPEQADAQNWHRLIRVNVQFVNGTKQEQEAGIGKYLLDYQKNMVPEAHGTVRETSVATFENGPTLYMEAELNERQKAGGFLGAWRLVTPYFMSITFQRKDQPFTDKEREMVKEVLKQKIEILFAP